IERVPLDRESGRSSLQRRPQIQRRGLRGIVRLPPPGRTGRMTSRVDVEYRGNAALGQRFAVDGFQKPEPKFVVHGEGSADDAMGELVLRAVRIASYLCPMANESRHDGR